MGHRFFQEALVRRGLETLGYDVEKPKTLVNPIFYKTVTLGDIDYWANGWFPMHNDQLPGNFDEKAEKIGYVIKAGGLGGYLISKKKPINTTLPLLQILNALKSSKHLILMEMVKRI
ncbi:hypothetical protein LFREDSHE_21720 [Shewanella baltica]